MAGKTLPTHADDCETILMILAQTDHEGLSMDEILAKLNELDALPRPWNLCRINDVLCGLRNQVSNQKVRGTGGKKVTKYYLKIKETL